VIQVTGKGPVRAHDAGVEHEAGPIGSATNTWSTAMITRSEIVMITLAALCIAASLLLGGMVLFDSAGQSPRSVGRLPVNVHSAQAHGLTVPGTARITTASVVD
jgi:hypothetical protein